MLDVQSTGSGLNMLDTFVGQSYNYTYGVQYTSALIELYWHHVVSSDDDIDFGMMLTADGHNSARPQRSSM
jgi:hypothetical protein